MRNFLSQLIHTTNDKVLLDACHKMNTFCECHSNFGENEMHIAPVWFDSRWHFRISSKSSQAETKITQTNNDSINKQDVIWHEMKLQWLCVYVRQENMQELLLYMYRNDSDKKGERGTENERERERSKKTSIEIIIWCVTENEEKFPSSSSVAHCNLFFLSTTTTTMTTTTIFFFL